MEAAGDTIGVLLEKLNCGGDGQYTRDDFAATLTTVLCAAGIGAAVCKSQGGMVVLKEEASDEDKQEAAQLLEELRQKLRTPDFGADAPL